MSTARECIAKIIKENIGGRKLISINKFPSLEEYLEENGINVFAHIYLDGITSSETQSIISLEQLEGNVDKYYVFVSTERDLDQLNKLKVLGGGYQLVKDYCTVQEMHRKIGNRTTPYHDTFNNKCNYVPENVEITFAGTNANIEFGKDLKVTAPLRITIYSDSKIIIGDNSEIKGEIKIQDNANLLIGKKIRGNFDSLVISDNTLIKIGDNTTFTSHVSMVCFKGVIIIGQDCMFASFTMIYCGNGHPTYDVITKEGTNESTDRNIVNIGNHVWVGIRCIILSKTEIQDGCIVGAGSVVKGKYPNNCVIAGNPSRIRKKNTAWSRFFGDTFDSIEEQYVCPTKDEE